MQQVHTDSEGPCWLGFACILLSLQLLVIVSLRLITNMKLHFVRL